jgi:hypothetical protein
LNTAATARAAAAPATKRPKLRPHSAGWCFGVHLSQLLLFRTQFRTLKFFLQRARHPLRRDRDHSKRR